MNDRKFLYLFCRQRCIFLHILQRTENQCERCTQLMCDIGVKTQAFLVQFLFLLMIFLFQCIEAFQIYFLFVSM